MTKRDDERDFGAILAEFEKESSGSGRKEDPSPGSKVAGTVVSVGEQGVFVDLGAKSDAMVSRAELVDDEGELTVGVGDRVEGIVGGRDEESGCLVLRVRPGAGSGLGGAGREIALEEISQAHAHGIPVEGSVTGAVKGGVEVTISGIRAFCPVSQLDTGFVESPETWVGRKLTFRVRSFSPSGRGGRPEVVVSRRDLLEEERRRQRQEVLDALEKGKVVRGTVASVVGYGAFVELGGGVQGLLHVSEMAHERIEDPTQILATGDVIEVEVLSVERKEEDEDPRISLSRRSLERDPWEGVEDRFPEGATVSGRVMRLEPYGAFVRIAPAIEGLVHVSELARDRRVAHPRDVVELGQDVTVKVLGADPAKRRISLSLAAVAESADSEALAEYQESRGDREEEGQFGSLAAAFRKLGDREGPDR